MLLLPAFFFLSFLHPAASVDVQYPQTVEIDLVFPRNDTYPPFWPFPIIFAVRNAAAAWPFDFQLIYEVQVFDKKENRFTGMPGGMKNFGHFPNAANTNDRDYPAGLDEPLLIMNASVAWANMTDTYGFVNWDIGFVYNCSEDVPLEESVSPVLKPIFGNYLYFTLSGDAPVPDFSALKGCPHLVGAREITGEMVPGDPFWEVGTCPIFAKDDPEGDPCGFNDDELATRVASEMAEYVGCPEAAWPNPTATECSESKGSGSNLQVWGWTGAAVVALACISLTM